MGRWVALIITTRHAVIRFAFSTALTFLPRTAVFVPGKKLALHFWAEGWNVVNWVETLRFGWNNFLTRVIFIFVCVYKENNNY